MQASSYMWDLSFHRFWYPPRTLESISVDTEGELYRIRKLVGAGGGEVKEAGMHEGTKTAGLMDTGR